MSESWEVARSLPRVYDSSSPYCRYSDSSSVTSSVAVSGSRYDGRVIHGPTLAASQYKVYLEFQVNQLALMNW